MIETLEIRNYRSCVDTVVDLQPDLSVFIGPNGSGKTNILNAYLLLRRLTEERELRSSQYKEEVLPDESKLKVTFLLDSKRAILTAGLQLFTDETNADVIVNATQSWYARDFTNSRKRIRLPLWVAVDFFARPELLQTSVEYQKAYWRARYNVTADVPSSFVRPITSISRFASQIRYYSASQFTNPSQCPVSFELEKLSGVGRRGRTRGHAKFLEDLYTEYRTRDTSRYNQFFEVIGPKGIGLVRKISFKEIAASSFDITVRSGGRVRQRKREKVLIIPQFTIGNNALSPSQLSEGTFKTITLLFYLMTEQSSALLIEEPEVCVHHGLLTSIVELIKTYSRRKQILLSTHSDALLDQLDPRHVYQVSHSHQRGTTVSPIDRSMSVADLAALKRYLATEGNLGEYWRHGGLD